MTSTHSELEICWSSLSAALLNVLDYAGCSAQFTALILSLCSYGREVFTWWNSRKHTMSFTNRGNGKSICDCLDKIALEGLGFMQQLSNTEDDHVIVPDGAIQIVNVWEELLNQLKLTEPLEPEEFPDGIHSNNLVDLYTWLRLIQTLLQCQHPPTPYLITQFMQTWLQLHMNLIRYSCFVNNKAKFTNSLEIVQACQQWMNNSLYTQNPDLHSTLQELLLWNDALIPNNNLPQEIERILTKEDDAQDDDIIDWCTRLSSSDDNNEEELYNNDNNNNDTTTMMVDDPALLPLEQEHEFTMSELPILEPDD